MQDERGIYYFAQPGNHKVRVYVRYGSDGEVEFRLWHMDYPEVWEKHQWLCMDVIREAAGLFAAERDPDANPQKLYDLELAKILLHEDKN